MGWFSACEHLLPGVTAPDGFLLVDGSLLTPRPFLQMMVVSPPLLPGWDHDPHQINQSLSLPWPWIGKATFEVLSLNSLPPEPINSYFALAALGWVC